MAHFNVQNKLNKIKKNKKTKKNSPILTDTKYISTR